MTVAAQTPIVSYIEDGTTTAFPAPFRYDSPADLRATRLLADGTTVELANGTAFTATPGPTNAGGTLTLTTAGPSGARLTIFRRSTRVQEADYIANGAFTAESHERALDKAMLVAQEQDQELDRAIKAPVGEAGPSLEPSAVRAGKVARFDGDGGFASLTLPELAVLLDPEKQAGTTLAFTELTGPRSQVVVFDPGGVGEGGYWCEFSAQAATDFVRAYARVFAGGGTCDVRATYGGEFLWSAEGLGSAAVDEVVDLTLPQGRDLIFVIENIVGTVTGVVIKLEGPAA